MAGSLDARLIVRLWRDPLYQEIEKGRCGWQLRNIRVRALSLYCLFSLYAMAGLYPPPLFSPANAGGNAADSGGLAIIHGEIFSPTMDQRSPLVMFISL